MSVPCSGSTRIPPPNKSPKIGKGRLPEARPGTGRRRDDLRAERAHLDHGCASQDRQGSRGAGEAGNRSNCTTARKWPHGTSAALPPCSSTAPPRDRHLPHPMLRPLYQANAGLSPVSRRTPAKPDADVRRATQRERTAAVLGLWQAADFAFSAVPCQLKKRLASPYQQGAKGFY